MRKCRLGDLSAEDAAGHCFPMSIYSQCEFNSPLELLSTVSLYRDLSGTFFCVQFLRTRFPVWEGFTPGFGRVPGCYEVMTVLKNDPSVCLERGRAHFR